MAELDTMVQERVQSTLQITKQLLDRRCQSMPGLTLRQHKASPQDFSDFIDGLVERVSSEHERLVEMGQTIGIVRQDYHHYERQIDALASRINEVESENKYQSPAPFCKTSTRSKSETTSSSARSNSSAKSSGGTANCRLY